MLKIYNSLSREKQVFVPIEPGKARMYVCGMTVYDYCHVGHARVLVVFDAVQRWLRASGFDVTYVRNITDIDDKIIKRALENNETIGELTNRFIAFMNEDSAALGVEKPDFEPRATEYVPQMLGLIGQLEKNGLAYQAADGDVNFAVRKFPGYGKLSGKSLDDLRAGERVDVDLADAEGLATLSMRNLAATLGVVPMALYKHVADKQDLVTGMIDAVVAGYPTPTEEGWRDRMRQRVLGARDALLAHPWLRGAIETSNRRTPVVLGHLDALAGEFFAAGFSADLTHHAMHVLGHRVWGFSPEAFDDSGSPPSPSNRRKDWSSPTPIAASSGPTRRSRGSPVTPPRN